MAESSIEPLDTMMPFSFVARRTIICFRRPRTPLSGSGASTESHAQTADQPRSAYERRGRFGLLPGSRSRACDGCAHSSDEYSRRMTHLGHPVEGVDH